MKTDETETSSTSASGLKSAAEKKTTWLSSTLWWTKVAQVRFRFVLIIVAAGLVVTQWAAVSNLWDRFVLRPVGLNAAAEISSGHEYFCPMDPGVLSAWPAICPICNMDLVPRRKTDAQILPAGVVSRMQLSPYRIQLAGLRTSKVELRPLPATDLSHDAAVEPAATSVLCIPATSVVDRGNERLVYVESMPGMFDGVAVKLGLRSGPFYPVVSGLEAGQQVVTSGAFLIDAEARLNPGLATGYFGASQPALSAATSTAPLVPIRSKSSTLAELSAQDQQLADLQETCPVTDLPLDSMGGAVPVMVGDRKVFICCAGCQKKLLQDPDKYLAKLPQSPDHQSPDHKGP